MSRAEGGVSANDRTALSGGTGYVMCRRADSYVSSEQPELNGVNDLVNQVRGRDFFMRPKTGRGRKQFQTKISIEDILSSLLQDKEIEGGRRYKRYAVNAATTQTRH